jgi:hypothetical protein
MDWKPVESSQISEVGYEEDTRILAIRFKTGAEYRYHNVDSDTHKHLLAAESVGRYFSSIIKAYPNRFPFRKVEA